MNRRTFVGCVAGGVFVASITAVAQQVGKTPRIGMLLPGAPPAPGQSSPALETFRKELRDLGYAEGTNLVIEYRWSEGREERFADLAADLIRLDVAVIITQGTPAVRAAKAATSTIPIVMVFVGDPVGIGVVASLARPGTNVTGFSLLDADLDSKRVDLLKQTVPGLSRLAILWSANDSGMTLAVSRIEVAARALGLSVQSLAVRAPEDFAGAFQAARSERAEALLVTVQPFTLLHRAQILELVAKHRLPAMYTLRSFVDGGGLLAYGPSLSDQYRRAASYVDKILHGAKAADLPVEQPTKFELVVNLKTATTLGLTIPQSVLMRADEVIQ
jgi:ABC-type uncharacterized transport system substrate-binding protein